MGIFEVAYRETIRGLDFQGLGVGRCMKISRATATVNVHIRAGVGQMEALPGERIAPSSTCCLMLIGRVRSVTVIHQPHDPAARHLQPTRRHAHVRQPAGHYRLDVQTLNAAK